MAVRKCILEVNYHIIKSRINCFGSPANLNFMYQLKQNEKKNSKFFSKMFTIFCNFSKFPHFFFGKISTDIKMSFPQSYKNNLERTKYQFFLLILANLLYALCCGRPSIRLMHFTLCKSVYLFRDSVLVR